VLLVSSRALVGRCGEPYCSGVLAQHMRGLLGAPRDKFEDSGHRPNDPHALRGRRLFRKFDSQLLSFCSTTCCQRNFGHATLQACAHAIGKVHERPGAFLCPRGTFRLLLRQTLGILEQRSRTWSGSTDVDLLNAGSNVGTSLRPSRLWCRCQYQKVSLLSFDTLKNCTSREHWPVT